MKKAADILSKTGKWLLVFGFVFSQVSFPIEVLAEELAEDEKDIMIIEENADSNSEDVQTEEPVIKINEEQLTEYTVKETTEVKVVLEYQGRTEEKVFDFNNKLYGIYQYTFSSVEKTVTINYPGNNIDLLKKVENETNVNITCTEDKCIISGIDTEVVTVENIKSYYDLEIFTNAYNAKVIITDENGNELTNDATIVNGYKLVIVDNQENAELVNTKPETTYTLEVEEISNIEYDQETILDDIIKENELDDSNDVNRDGKLNILDVTHPTFIETPTVEDITDVLTNELTIDVSETYIDETVEVKLFVSGLEQLSLYGIEGLLTYDDTILELTGATLYQVTSEEVENLGYLNLENGKFAYVLSEGFNDNEVALLTLTFKALALGTTEITISNILESYGLNTFEVENDSTTVNLTVIEYGKGGDEENKDDNTTDNETPKDEKEEETTDKEDVKKEEVEKDNTSTSVITPVVKSSDYYINNLIIKGYDIDFDKYTYEYSIKVGSDVTSLDLEVLLNSSKSIYYVEGNENFKNGENLVYVTVKAENGSTKTYTIKVEKEKQETNEEKTEVDEEDIEDKETSNVSKTIIIILIILVIIGLIYVIFKDDEEDTKEVKKEKNPEKAKSEKTKVETKNTTNAKKKNNNKNSNNKNTKKSNKK